MRRVETRPDPVDAAFALGNVAFNLARIPAYALEHRVAERIAEELAANVDLEAAITAALDHELTQRLMQAVLASPAMQQTIEHVAASPEVRAALTTQSSTLAEEMVAGVRTRAETLDDAAERTVRGWLRRPRIA
jgi:hypothetical protein